MYMTTGAGHDLLVFYNTDHPYSYYYSIGVVNIIEDI